MGSRSVPSRRSRRSPKSSQRTGTLLYLCPKSRGPTNFGLRLLRTSVPHDQEIRLCTRRLRSETSIFVQDRSYKQTSQTARRKFNLMFALMILRRSSNGVLATILFILPAPNSNIEGLEKTLATNPGSVEALLSRRQGYAQLPPFHFSSDLNLRESLEKMEFIGFSRTQRRWRECSLAPEDL